MGRGGGGGGDLKNHVFRTLWHRSTTTTTMTTMMGRGVWKRSPFVRQADLVVYYSPPPTESQRGGRNLLE